MYRAAVLFAVIAVVVVPNLADTNCESKDEDINNTLIPSLRQQLAKSNGEFLSISDQNYHIFGIGVSWTGGHAGNFSSLRLTPPVAGGSSSNFCTTNTSETSTQTLQLNVGFDDLEVEFGTLQVSLIFFTLTSPGFKVSLSGENLNMEIQRKVVIATGVCTPSVENFEFTNWGNLRVDFGSGIINWVLTKIFNNYFSATLMGFLEAFNVSSMINNAVRGTVTTIIQETGQAETVCDFFKLLSV